MKIYPSKANGEMLCPPSKSMAHRNLICAALAEGQSIIRNVDFSEDIKATLSCIKELGAQYTIENNTVTIRGNPGFALQPQAQDHTPAQGQVQPQSQAQTHSASQTLNFNCNESGSTLRFFIPLAMLQDKPSVFSGSQVLMTRPLSVYEKICQSQGIKLEQKEGKVYLQGKLHATDFEIPGNISSQFITGLLFTLPLLNEDSKIILTESIESKPYIDMTLQVQKDFRIEAAWINENTLLVKGNQKYKNTDTYVEGDYSNAAFFEALNTLGGKVKINGLRKDSLQGDKVYLPYFNALCKDFARLDISDCPDLGPVLFVVAAAHNGGEFTGTKRLAIKESNRGQVMCQELAKFGIKTLQEENRIVIYKSELKRPEEVLQGHNDHRIVMSLATLLTLTGGRIEGISAVKKSLPDYFKRIKNLGIKFDYDIEGESDGMDK